MNWSLCPLPYQICFMIQHLFGVWLVALKSDKQNWLVKVWHVLNLFTTQQDLFVFVTTSHTSCVCSVCFKPINPVSGVKCVECEHMCSSCSERPPATRSKVVLVKLNCAAFCTLRSASWMKAKNCGKNKRKMSSCCCMTNINAEGLIDFYFWTATTELTHSHTIYSGISFSCQFVINLHTFSQWTLVDFH